MAKQAENKTKIELLKSNSKSAKTGKIFTNLYLRINDGNPILIDLVKFNPKVRGLLLAVAMEANISRVCVVSPVNEEDKPF